MKTTLKNIRSYIATGSTVNVTDYPANEINTLRTVEGGFSEVMHSENYLGYNGIIVQGYNTGSLYAVIGRCSALLLVM